MGWAGEGWVGGAWVGGGGGVRELVLGSDLQGEGRRIGP